VDLFAIELVAIVVKIEFRDFKRTYYLGRREWPNWFIVQNWLPYLKPFTRQLRYFQKIIVQGYLCNEIFTTLFNKQVAEVCE